MNTLLGQERTILIIDDNPTALRTIEGYLQAYGFEILIARSGKSGLQRAQLVHPDLILLDVLMPGIDGFETCRRLKSDPTTQDTPIIFMTALDETEHKVKGFQMGAVDYITKPIQEDELLARVLTHLRLQELNRHLEHQVCKRTTELTTANQQLEQEIVERMRVEQALRESEEKYRRVVENANESIVIAQDGIIQFFNPKTIEITGYTYAELDARPFIELIYQDDRETLATRHAKRLKGEPAPHVYAFRIIHKDGDIRWIEIRAVLIEWEGRPATLSFLNDITERKQTEQERERLLLQIQEQASRIQQIVDTVPVGVLLLDADGQIILANPMAKHDTAALADIQVGNRLVRLGDRSLQELLAPPPEGLWHYVTTGERDFQIIARSLQASPVSEVWVMVIRDITHEREMQQRIQQQDRLAVIGQLAGGVAHDFNNILTVIRGYTDLIFSQTRSDDPIREDLEQVIDAAKRASTLTNQLLIFSRKQVPQPSQLLDLDDIVANMERMLRRLIGEDIELITKPPLSRHLIRADLGQIEQVIMNLAVNARDAIRQSSAPQSGQVIIETKNIILDEFYACEHLDIEPGPYVMLIVSDTGTGMTDEVKAHIFEPFFTTKEKGQGTGLGLATVYGIVKQSNGCIEVVSKPSVGTTFKLYFPRAQGEAASITQTKSSHSSWKGHETILLVEDQDSVRRLARRILEQCGYTVLEAPLPSHALRTSQAFNKPIDLLITDVVMPEMSGRDLAEQITTSRLETKVLYISGYTDSTISKHSVPNQGVELLEKPFTSRTLADKVRQVLDKPPPTATG